MIEGIFRSGAVSPFRAGYAGEATNFRLNGEFSYRVGNSVHPGEYFHKFGTEEDGLALLRSLQQGPFYIRYDHVSPSEYIVDPYHDVLARGAHDQGRQAAYADN
jgi:hypothetical protein